MSKFIDLAGKRFGRLVVVRRATGKDTHNAYWHCRCDCGRNAIVASSHLTHGDTSSCGCLNIERMHQQFRTHGETTKHSREYNAWCAMKDRCYNPNCRMYKCYGGRGITISDKWKNSFETFLHDMGRAPSGYTLDRIDNDKGYSKDNCRWATYKENNNNRRDNLRITYKGETMTVSQWADRLEIKLTTLYQRLRKCKWSVERALNEPVQERLLTFQGSTRTATEWAHTLNVKPATIFTRVHKGLPVEKVLSPTHLRYGRTLQ